ncbi:YcnI family copper-binding membrane protein [Kribbella sp. CA-247076]|uniref:YcnI family copper-binding membrane protein n=1 Tax=Kribbella sp. CA-247076 TaxID=3239941 RepID=UPI003D8F3AC0
MKTALRRTLAIGALTAGGLVLAGTPAFAHVGVTPSVTTAGEYSVLTVSVPHGCDGSPTTKVSIKIPEEFTSVTPTVNPNWTVQKVMAKLATPIKDSHGNEITERVGEVVYTAKTPLADDLRDKFELSAKLPDKPGKLVFPTVQTCAKGETAWVEVAKDGQSEDDLEAPAPGFEVTAADSESDSESDGEPAATGNAAAAASVDDGTPAVTWVALGVGVLGLAVGGAALVRTRRS